MNYKALVRWLPIAGALAIGTTIAMWPSMKFVNQGGSDFASRFSTIIFFSLLIERTVEIIMTIWRSAEANKLEAVVQRLLLASNIPSADPAFISAQDELISYKAETMQWTIPLGFALGLLVSSVGVRVLSQFVDPASTSLGATSAEQRWWFNMTDIVFTGALLASGADPIHKLLDLYRKLVEASAAKVAGTKPQ